MALPMGLCPDSKRGLNFYMFKKNQNNNTMMDKRGCAVFSTSSPCSASHIVNVKQSISGLMPAPSFHTRTLNSVLVGGFLGSKSQGRSTNSLQSVWEIIPDLFNAATECFQQCNFSSVPSPPKKKFAKGENIANFTYVDTIEFPVIEDHTCEESRADGSKQSYAEVAKAATCKPSRYENCKGSKGSTEAGSHKDNTKAGSRKDNSNRRRTDSGDHRSSRRRSNKRERGESTPRRLFSGSTASPSAECRSEPLKDLRLCQQEKHFSQLQIAASNRNLKKSDRLSSSSIDTDRRDRVRSDHTEGKHRPKRRSNYRTHCDNKRGNRAKHFDCDIDKINWRTGEPISDRMGLENDVNSEDYLAGQSCNNSFTSEQTNEGCTGEQRKPDTMLETSRHDLPSAQSPRCRRRSLSECSVGSEDSFIVFQTGGAPSDSLSDQGSDWSDCDSDDSFETDSEMSDEEDMCDGMYPSSRLNEVNEYWQREYALDTSSSDGDRKVHFSRSQPTIHRMLAWDYAYRAARPGPWEQMGRDRDRFKTRIRQCEAILSPVLTSEHRNKLWNRLHSS